MSARKARSPSSAKAKARKPATTKGKAAPAKPTSRPAPRKAAKTSAKKSAKKSMKVPAKRTRAKPKAVVDEVVLPPHGPAPEPIPGVESSVPVVEPIDVAQEPPATPGGPPTVAEPVATSPQVVPSPEPQFPPAIEPDPPRRVGRADASAIIRDARMLRRLEKEEDRVRRRDGRHARRDLEARAARKVPLEPSDVLDARPDRVLPTRGRGWDDVRLRCPNCGHANERKAVTCDHCRALL